MTSTNSELATLFLAFSRQKLFGQYWPRLKECVAPLSEEQLWWRPNDASNSIGNLLLHLNGNVGQWLVASFNKDGASATDRLSSRQRAKLLPPNCSLRWAQRSTRLRRCWIF